MFWENFWPNLAADSIIALVFGFLIIRFLDFIRKPKELEFIWNNSRTNTIKAVKGNLDADGYLLKGQLVIKNTGGRLWSDGSIFKEPIYWHLILPEQLNVIELDVLDPSKSPQTRPLEDKINGGRYLNIYGCTETPLYPHSFLQLNFKIQAQFMGVNEQFIYYHFNTEFGRYPRDVVETEDFNVIKKTYKKLIISTS